MVTIQYGKVQLMTQTSVYHDDSRRVLDVGVTCDDSYQESNFFEHMYPYPFASRISARNPQEDFRLFPAAKRSRARDVLAPSSPSP